LKRGEIWTVSGGSAYTGKPRPALIVQDDRFASTSSVTICPLTTSSLDVPLFRPEVRPSPETGLISLSRIMIDKITPVPRARLGKRLGRLQGGDVMRTDRALLVFLGMARSS
jgi:mRNA interferase MazF